MQNKLIFSNSPSSKADDWENSLRKMSWWNKDKIREAKVLVVGTGALGNEVLKNLTLLNIGHLFIVDFDIIEYPNLSRSILFRESDINRLKVDAAAERIKEINPQVKVQTLNGDITADVGLGVFRRMDVIICCVDNRMARLFINRACHKVNKIWIDGAIQDLGGQVEVYKPKQNCYECGLSSLDLEFIAKRSSCPDIAVIRESQGSIATTPLSASIFGALQAQEALKLIFEEKEHEKSMTKRSFYFQGRTNEVLQRNYPKRKSYCNSHYDYQNILASALSCTMTVAEARQALAQLLEEKDPDIILENQLILEVTTKETNKVKKVAIPSPHLTNEVIKQYQELPGEALVITQKTNKLDNDFEQTELTLLQCGIPPLQIIEVITDNGRYYVELTADEEYLNFK